MSREDAADGRSTDEVSIELATEASREQISSQSAQPQLSGPVQGFIEGPEIADSLEGRAVVDAKRSSLQLEGMKPSPEFKREFASRGFKTPVSSDTKKKYKSRPRLQYVSVWIGVLMLVFFACLMFVGLWLID